MSEHAWAVYGPVVDDISQVQFQLAQLESAQVRMLGQLCQRVCADAKQSGRDVAWEVIAIQADVAVNLNLSERVVGGMMDLGLALITQLPETLAAWSGGLITRRHVEVIVREARGLESDETARLESALLTIAVKEPPAVVRRAAMRLRETLRRDTILERHLAARAERCVTLTAADDGMAWLSVLMPAADAAAAYDRTRQISRALRDADAQQDDADVAERRPKRRTVTQIHADVFRDLLIGGVTGPAQAVSGEGIRANVVLTVPVLSLLGHSDEPPVLQGHGPIDSETAAELCRHAPSFQRILTHPLTGVTLAHDRNTYRPPPELRRMVKHRDQTCRFPGCLRSANSCEIDHTINWEWGGPTDADNLACLCRRHHVMKHTTDWNIKNVGGGILHWTSPTGVRRISRPPGYESPSHDSPRFEHASAPF